jgi:hypothetical protein
MHRGSQCRRWDSEGHLRPRDFTTADGIAVIYRPWSRVMGGVAVSEAIVAAQSDRAIGPS